MTIAQSFTSLIAPPCCLLCGAPGQYGGEIWGLDLCRHCEAACPRPPESCDSRGAPAGSGEAEAVAGCDRLRVLYLYRPPVDHLITQLKFAADPVPARVLAMLFARALRPLCGEPLQCIVPMPLHPKRLRERGFNQCELIASHLAPRLSLPVRARLLERHRETSAQSGLPGGARRTNIAGAFRVRAGVQVPRRIALLDDVMTTGSTLGEAVRTLRAAGATHVEGWICALTPLKDVDHGV